MKHLWNKINKIIGIVNLTVGIIIIYKVFDFTKMQIKQMEKLSKQNGLSKFDVSISELLFSYRFQILMGIIFVFSGILFLFRKQLGWIIGYSAWIITTLFLLPITIYRIRDVTITIIGNENWIQIYSGIGLTLSLIVLILLSLKPIRIINKIDEKSWIYSFGIVWVLYLLPRII